MLGRGHLFVNPFGPVTFIFVEVVIFGNMSIRPVSIQLLRHQRLIIVIFLHLSYLQILLKNGDLREKLVLEFLICLEEVVGSRVLEVLI